MFLSNYAVSGKEKIRFIKNKGASTLEFHEEVASMVNRFFDKKTGSRANLNGQLAQYLKIILWQQKYLKWDLYLLRIKVINIYCMIDVLTVYACVEPFKDKKSRTVPEVNRFC